MTAAPGVKFVFDFGGVLFHWRPPLLLQRVLPRRASDAASAEHWVAEIFQSYGGDWAEFDRGSVTPAQLVDRIARRTGLDAAEVQAVVDAVPGELQPVAEMVALLRQLHAAGHTLYYLSNMPAGYARHLEDSHPFIGLFADGVFSARVNHIKPEPAIFALAAERFATPPQQLVFIDDLGPNVDAARAQGWHAVRAESAAQVAAELGQRGWLAPAQAD